MDHSNRTNFGQTALQRTGIMLALAIGLGIAFDVLLAGKLPGVSFPIYILLTVAAFLGVARMHRHQLPRTALFMIPFIMFFSAMVYIRANEFLTLCNIVITFYLLGLFILLTLKPRLRTYGFLDYLSLIMHIPLRALRKAADTLQPIIAARGFFARHQRVPQIIRGVLIALPILLIFLGLFASADLVFREYVSGLFNIRISDELFLQVFWFVVVFSLSLGVFGLLGERHETSDDTEATEPKASKLGLVEVSILFGSLNVLFFSFIMVQLAYLFGGAANVVDGDFTYAEYARKGFFELIAVAGFSLLVIFVAERLLLRERQRHDVRFKALSGLLIVQVLIIMVSALKRLQLYESAYGFTSLRLLSYVFLGWLAVVFCIFLYKIFADRRENELAFATFISVLAVFALINVMNVDGTVARKNIDRYESTGKLDVRYLEDLSDDATVEVIRLLDSEDEKLRGNLAASLYDRYKILQTKDDNWQSANITRHAAMHELNEHLVLLEQNKDRLPDPEYRGPGQR